MYLVALPKRIRRATASWARLLAAAPARLNPMHEMRFLNSRCTPIMVSPEARDPAAENAKM